MTNPWRATPRFQDGLRRGPCGISILFAIGHVASEHHESCIEVIRNILSGLRKRMHSFEVTRVAEIRPESRTELLHNLVGVALQLLGTILREFRDGWLYGVPVTRTILLEVRCRPGQPP